MLRRRCTALRLATACRLTRKRMLCRQWLDLHRCAEIFVWNACQVAECCLHALLSCLAPNTTSQSTMLRRYVTVGPRWHHVMLLQAGSDLQDDFVVYRSM